MFKQKEDKRKEQGYYRITCTAHGTPMATWCGVEKDYAEEWARDNRQDPGVHVPPPYRVEHFDTMAEALHAAEVLAEVYKGEAQR